MLFTLPQFTTPCTEREKPTFFTLGYFGRLYMFITFGPIQHRDVNSPLAENGLCLVTNSTKAQPNRQKKVTSLLRGATNCKCEVPNGYRCAALGGSFFFFWRNTLYVKNIKQYLQRLITGSEGNRRLRPPDFETRFSALSSGSLYPTRKYSWYSLLLEIESTSGPQCGRQNYVI